VRLVVVASLVASVLCSVVPSAAATVLPGFRSPSGNIRCLFVPGVRPLGGGPAPTDLRCDIARASYAKTLQARCMRPDGSGVDWHGFELGTGRKGAVTCSGGILYNPGTQHPSYVTLPYGKTWRHGGYTCWSRITGVTCRNVAGHGLFVAREAWRVW